MEYHVSLVEVEHGSLRRGEKRAAKLHTKRYKGIFNKIQAPYLLYIRIIFLSPPPSVLYYYFLNDKTPSAALRKSLEDCCNALRDFAKHKTMASSLPLQTAR
jgi:hypothetical protein